MSDGRTEGQQPVAISGELTIFTAAALKQMLVDGINQAQTNELDVDLSEVTEIDTAGLQLMVMAKKEASAKGKNLRFINHSPPVLDLIDLCDLSGFFGDPILIHPAA